MIERTENTELLLLRKELDALQKRVAVLEDLLWETTDEFYYSEGTD